MPARRLPSWVWVTGLTAAALVGVTALAAQADQGAHPVASAKRPKSSATAGPHPSAAPRKSAPAAVPGDSGTGRRIVYSLAQRRVWLVDATGAASRTFTVWPGTVSPDSGTYMISRTLPATTGSDGVQIEHIVYFANKSGLSVAFSNAVDGSSPPPAAGKRTSGIRMHRADGAVLWDFATQPKTRVVVVA
ncbi:MULTISPECIES: hypothetical protein [unclassified Streptomyces]|uniref:hypothetical protein n=1 Tax=unclassified Streptomyces TaxID=2593676 RepID=UPI0036A4242D